MKTAEDWTNLSGVFGMSCFSKIPFFQNSDLRVKSLFILKRHLFTDLLTFFKKTTESFQKNVILENQKRTFSKYVTYSVKEQNNFKRTLFGKNNRTISKNITYSERTLESFQKNVIRRMDLLPPTFYVGRRLWKQ